jgi:hypothetical protein
MEYAVLNVYPPAVWRGIFYFVKKNRQIFMLLLVFIVEKNHAIILFIHIIHNIHKIKTA